MCVNSPGRTMQVQSTPITTEVPMGSFTKLVVAPALTLGAIVGLASLTTPDDPAGATSPPSVTATYSHEVLQRDADMTQQMSAPSANTSAQLHRDDEQLVRSQDPAYLRGLEQHQAGLDQMLATPTP
jgi:hypothetical protein